MLPPKVSGATSTTLHGSSLILLAEQSTTTSAGQNIIGFISSKVQNMGNLGKHHQFQQICISATKSEYKPVSAAEADPGDRHSDRGAYHSAILISRKQHLIPSRLEIIVHI